MKWVTKERVRVDRVASAWLIQRFIDRDAEFLFTTEQEVIPRAKDVGGIPFHVPGVELGQEPSRTVFEAILRKYQLNSPAMERLADMVSGADRRGNAFEGPGIRAISQGFIDLGIDDNRILQLEMPLFDALYAFCQQRPEVKTD